MNLHFEFFLSRHQRVPTLLLLSLLLLIVALSPINNGGRLAISNVLDQVFPALAASTFGSFRDLYVTQLQLLKPHYIVFAPPLSACERTTLCSAEKRSSLLFFGMIRTSGNEAVSRTSWSAVGGAKKKKKTRGGGYIYTQAWT